MIVNGGRPGSLPVRIPTTMETIRAGQLEQRINASDSEDAQVLPQPERAQALARFHYRLNRQWSAALGVDNPNNASYWAFHPYPQRTAVAQLRFDL